MKKLYTLLIGFLITATATYSQAGAYDDFEDGTLQNWTITDGSNTLLTNENNTPPPGKHLEKKCDNTNSAVGQMAISNTVQWTGNFYGIGGGVSCVCYITFTVKNPNSFDLYLRLGFKGADNTKAVSSTPQIIPAFSDWTEIGFEHEMDIVSGSNTLEEVLLDVQEMRLIHNQELSYDGEVVDGILGIDTIGAVTLSNDEFSKVNIQLYPNPVKDFFTVRMPFQSESNIEIYDVFGKKIWNSKLKSLENMVDISNFSSGVYFLKISNNNNIFTQKILKY